MESLQFSYELDKLIDIVEERKRLVLQLKIGPSANDNVTLKKQLNKILDLLNEASGDRFEGLEEYVKNYNNILSEIPDDAVDVGLYQYQLSQRAVPFGITDSGSLSSDNSTPRDTTKKVRFRDDNLVSYEENLNQNFAPFKDSPEVDIEMSKNDSAIEQERQKLFDSSNALEETTSVISPQLSNQELFIQQQQQLLEQDSQLERLSGSIRTTHGISLNINEEVNEQNDQVLHDLESLVDNGGRNLDRARRRLKSFERSAKENGPCFIIVLLILILIMLLAVL